GLTTISQVIKNRFSQALLISLFFIFYISRSWQNTLPSFYIDWHWYKTLTEIGEILPDNSYGIFATAGYDWNSAYSYYLKKKLLTISVEDLSQEKVHSWQKDNYSFLILYDENKSLTRLKELGLPDHLDWLEIYPLIYHQNNIKIYQI
ncbi:MAG TPA: hypothetical protein VJB06_02365, partial [archaeon]|nr:hypothetical protein [archaeon]